LPVPCCCASEDIVFVGGVNPKRRRGDVRC
jgi:hypothetical protein